jgi:hypothetical protein
LKLLGQYGNGVGACLSTEKDCLFYIIFGAAPFMELYFSIDGE